MRGRPKAKEVVAKTNHKVDEYYRKKSVQGDITMSVHHVEEQKQQDVHLPEEEKKEVSRPNEKTK